VSNPDCQGSLVAVLDRHAALAIAVSGGVDSMMLAFVAGRYSRAAVTVVHAVSPAVPAAATRRVEAYAGRYNWALRCIDAGELADPDYRANPSDRCYYCKSTLYSAIRSVIQVTIASGTNVDDLQDYRPGLAAARLHGVIHPFVEAGFAKADIYTLARTHGLDDLAALPAQPCLASRIETGITVDPESLGFIEMVESDLGVLLPASVPLRCRITASGVFIECGEVPDGHAAQCIDERLTRLCSDAGRVYAGIRPYRRGSAFLRGNAA
jgi:uncharacterized protein